MSALLPNGARHGERSEAIQGRGTLPSAAAPWIASLALAMTAGVVLSCVFFSASAFAADDASSCAEGITMIRDTLASNPPEGAVAKLKKALKNAEREQREGEYDECLDAVSDAKKALGR